MSRSISVGELRQNPTEALDAVQDGETIVVTRNRRPIAQLVPHTRAPGTSGAELTTHHWLTAVDEEWAGDLAAARAAADRDLW